MKLRLGKLPNTDFVKLSIKVPMPVKDQLERYAELHNKIYGERSEVEAIIVQILSQFLARDRAFQKVLRSSSKIAAPP